MRTANSLPASDAPLMRCRAGLTRAGAFGVLVAGLAFPVAAGLTAGPAAASSPSATAYITNYVVSGSVIPLNTATGDTGTPIPVGDLPSDVAITPNGATAYVVNEGGDNVTPIDIATSTAGTPITVGTNPWG